MRPWANGKDETQSSRQSRQQNRLAHSLREHKYILLSRRSRVCRKIVCEGCSVRLYFYSRHIFSPRSGRERGRKHLRSRLFRMRLITPVETVS
ncbi:hypothetical protein CDAR_464141 [Caerostris darwini]|uniref:Uncharacterized protein n=1 Tax=Caerostris darwini TaxID=1538125 RepID=A0AAV4VTI1_9ARAC|nr:hypothetical protein CDAR_464141 [Caerostris darwini]